MKLSFVLLPLLAVAACGGATTAAVPTASQPPRVGSTPQAAPGASGLLAAVDGTTLQVQSGSDQTAVTYSATTRFTRAVLAKASDVVVGTCVQVRSASPAGGNASSSPAPSTSVTATAVTISAAVDGVCVGPGAGGGRNARGSGNGGTPPSRAPGGARRAGGGGTFGLVTAVQGGTFTVAATRRGQSGTPSSAIPVMVARAATTVYTTSGPAAASDLKVGLCVTARGKADDTGTVAATAIALRPATDGSCSNGFGGRGA